MATSIEIFPNEDDDGAESISLILRDPSIVEYEDELVSCCGMNSAQARGLAAGLLLLASRMDDADA